MKHLERTRSYTLQKAPKDKRRQSSESLLPIYFHLACLLLLLQSLLLDFAPLGIDAIVQLLPAQLVAFRVLALAFSEGCITLGFKTTRARQMLAHVRPAHEWASTSVLCRVVRTPLLLIVNVQICGGRVRKNATG